MQTGPVVTLQVAKLGACYHGLEALLCEAPSVTNTGMSRERIETVTSIIDIFESRLEEFFFFFMSVSS